MITSKEELQKMLQALKAVNSHFCFVVCDEQGQPAGFIATAGTATLLLIADQVGNLPAGEVEQAKLYPSIDYDALTFAAKRAKRGDRIKIGLNADRDRVIIGIGSRSADFPIRSVSQDGATAEMLVVPIRHYRREPGSTSEVVATVSGLDRLGRILHALPQDRSKAEHLYRVYIGEEDPVMYASNGVILATTERPVIRTGEEDRTDLIQNRTIKQDAAEWLARWALPHMVAVINRDASATDMHLMLDHTLRGVYSTRMQLPDGGGLPISRIVSEPYGSEITAEVGELLKVVHDALALGRERLRLETYADGNLKITDDFVNYIALVSAKGRWESDRSEIYLNTKHLQKVMLSFGGEKTVAIANAPKIVTRFRGEDGTATQYFAQMRPPR